MDEYIKRETVVNNLELLARHEDRFRQSVILGIVETIRTMEAADVAPVRHGRWAYGEDDNIQCSVCGHDAYTEGDYRQVKTNYCPNCGAKMNLEDTKND